MKATCNAQSPTGEKELHERHELNAMITEVVDSVMKKNMRKASRAHEQQVQQAAMHMEKLHLAEGDISEFDISSDSEQSA